MPIGQAIVSTHGLAKKIKLSDEELKISVVSVNPEFSIVRYPDGHERHHQISSVNDLCDRISNQLKNRYNVLSFNFKTLPEKLQPCEIIIGEIKYDA